MEWIRPEPERSDAGELEGVRPLNHGVDKANGLIFAYLRSSNFSP